MMHGQIQIKFPNVAGGNMILGISQRAGDMGPGMGVQ